MYTCHHNDYYPFLSKASALMFVLCNGLKPVVRPNQIAYNCLSDKRLQYIFNQQRETVLRFVAHCCKELDYHFPSLNQVKAISLPGYIPPKKVILIIILTYFFGIIPYNALHIDLC